MAFEERAKTPTSRALRADARKNRDAILRAAREVFELEGVLTPLDGIALRAGVGNATLYRNFPNREDLLAAVMDQDLDEARTKAKTLATELAPRQALAEWLAWLTWRLRIWHDLPHCVATASDEQGSSMNPAISLLIRLTEDLLASAQSAGTALQSISAREVFELAVTLSWAVDRFGDDESSALRRVQVATAGIFP